MVGYGVPGTDGVYRYFSAYDRGEPRELGICYDGTAHFDGILISAPHEPKRPVNATTSPLRLPLTSEPLAGIALDNA